MARARSIKPGFFANERLAALGPHAQLLFAGLWTIADRDGRLEDRPQRIKRDCLPYYECDVEQLLDSLSGGADPFIIRYESGGSRFIQVVKWQQHQSPHVREPESGIPSPVPDPMQGNTNATCSRNRNGESVKGDARGKRFTPPTVADVTAYCGERKNAVAPQQFVDFYESKGWRVGNQSMRDWKAAVRTWEQNIKARGPGAEPLKPPEVRRAEREAVAAKAQAQRDAAAAKLALDAAHAELLERDHGAELDAMDATQVRKLAAAHLEPEEFDFLCKRMPKPPLPRSMLRTACLEILRELTTQTVT